MNLKIIVLAKQVPDTRNVGKDAMTAEALLTAPRCRQSLTLKTLMPLNRHSD